MGWRRSRGGYDPWLKRLFLLANIRLFRISWSSFLLWKFVWQVFYIPMSPGWLLSYRVDLRRWTISPTWVLSSSSTPIYPQRKLDPWPSHSQIRITVSFFSFFPSSSPAYEPSFLPPVQTLERVSAKLEEQHEDWDDLDISSLIHTVRADLNINQKTFMSILRYALTGMKVRWTLSPPLVWIQDWTGECGYRKDLVFLKSWMC